MAQPTMHAHCLLKARVDAALNAPLVLSGPRREFSIDSLTDNQLITFCFGDVRTIALYAPSTTVVTVAVTLRNSPVVLQGVMRSRLGANDDLRDLFQAAAIGAPLPGPPLPGWTMVDAVCRNFVCFWSEGKLVMLSAADILAHSHSHNEKEPEFRFYFRDGGERQWLVEAVYRDFLPTWISLASQRCFDGRLNEARQRWAASCRRKAEEAQRANVPAAAPKEDVGDASGPPRAKREKVEEK